MISWRADERWRRLPDRRLGAEAARSLVILADCFNGAVIEAPKADLCRLGRTDEGTRAAGRVGNYDQSRAEAGAVRCYFSGRSVGGNGDGGNAAGRPSALFCIIIVQATVKVGTPSQLQRCSMLLE